MKEENNKKANEAERVKKIGVLGIFQSDKYVIPRYQRAYAWEREQIEQLIDDILDFGQNNYYIGSLIVAKVEGLENTYEVVDGQQRLTTLYLLLQYLCPNEIVINNDDPSLSFDCRDNSKYTLLNLKRIVDQVKEPGSTDKKTKGDSNNPVEDDRIEQSILNAIDVIHQKLASDEQVVNNLKEQLKKVIIYRIEVPEHTDLNRYFEIMNTRGEQLELHHILKAQLMGEISDLAEKDIFARVWDACSDMTGYVQMHFTLAERKKIFQGTWDKEPSAEWEDYKECFGNNSQELIGKSIRDIIRNFKEDDSDVIQEDGKRVRFESIIDFPHFLLHSLRVFVNVKNITVDKLGDQLDDRKLLQDFAEVKKTNYNSNEKFSKDFILHLLKARYLFDKFIIKREFKGENSEGSWSLQELCKQSQKDAAYVKNTEIKSKREWKKTYERRNKECLMIQSAFRVSYTSPKTMHWITKIMTWLFKDQNETKNLLDQAEYIAKQAVIDFINNQNDWKRGVQTPHIVFNVLDYILWKNDQQNIKPSYNDFVFEFRNSVEHWYPQHPSEGTSIDPWEEVDSFGNLCIISRRINSKFSNLSPKSKMEMYREHVNKGSIKLRIMGEWIDNHTNQEWKSNDGYKKHQDSMLDTLTNFIGTTYETEHQ